MLTQVDLVQDQDGSFGLLRLLPYILGSLRRATTDIYHVRLGRVSWCRRCTSRCFPIASTLSCVTADTDPTQFFTVPLVVLIALDFPRRKNWIWQPMLFGAAWVLADVVMIEAHQCGFFSTNNTCGKKNFLNMLGFAFGQPVLALLAMRQNRLFAMIGAAQWMIVAGVLLMTQNNAPTLFYRNMVNCGFLPAYGSRSL